MIRTELLNVAERGARPARERLHGVTVHTRLFPCDGAYLKPESFQPIGSFKLRGAYNKTAALVEQERPTGIVAHSSGNHAQGVAYAAQKLGLPAAIPLSNGTYWLAVGFYNLNFFNFGWVVEQTTVTARRGAFDLNFRTDVEAAGVPEPGAWMMLCTGLGGVLAARRRCVKLER